MTTMKNTGSVVALALCTSLFGFGCGGGNKEVNTGGKGGGPVTPKAVVEERALERFNAALDAFNAHDKANDWNDQACAENAKQFESAASVNDSGKFPEATYDAGLAYQRCGDDKDAKGHFQQALSDEP